MSRKKRHKICIVYIIFQIKLLSLKRICWFSPDFRDNEKMQAKARLMCSTWIIRVTSSRPNVNMNAIILESLNARVIYISPLSYCLPQYFS